MAAVNNSLNDVRFSRDEIVLLENSIKDENFRKLLEDFANEVNDPNKRQQYEDEVKQCEKERGVDLVFLDPSPGFALVVSGGGEEGKCEDYPVCVNICSSDVIQEPSLARARHGNTLGHTWSIPHAVTKPRVELVNGSAQLLRELHRGSAAKKHNVNNNAKLRVRVYDVVFHPDTLYLALNNDGMKKSVIHTAMEALKVQHQLEAKEPQEMKYAKYVSQPARCVIKKVMDKETYENNHDKLDFLNKTEDERTKANGSVDKAKKPNRNQSTSNVMKKKMECEVIAPKYIIKHVNKADLQDFALIPGSEASWRAQALQVEVLLPGVERAAQVDADIGNQSISITTATTPKYGVEIPLPYAVDEESSTAKFDLSTHKLTFLLSVMSSKNIMTMSMPSPSSSLDSGIECETGFRTNSDGDNSSEVSVSSYEEVSKDDREEVVEEDDDDDEGSVFESAPSSPIRGFVVPNYSLKESERTLYLNLSCRNVVADSVRIQQSNGNRTVAVNLTTIGAGQTPLCFSLSLDCSPHEVSSNGVSFKICEDHVAVSIAKAKKILWEKIQIGKANSLQSASVLKIDESPVAQQTKDELSMHGLGNGESVSPRKPRVTRAVSMCEESPSLPSSRLKGPTCSWPRGILKRRSRSLSESQLGVVVPLESLGINRETSMETDLQEDRDGEESIDESISSSLGEKKSVRFNDVVSRQLFRSNSSILGRKAKNQKKSLKKQKSRNRHASGSDRDSDTNQCHSDPEPSSDFTATTTTTSEEEDTDATTEADEFDSAMEKTGTAANNAFCDIDLDVENNNNKNLALSNSATTAAVMSNEEVNDDDNEGFIVKTSKKKKNKNKKNKKFEPSNNFIFQLDIEP